MKQIILLTSLFLMFSNTYADEIITKQGKIFKNVKILSDAYKYVTFMFNDKERMINKDQLISWSKDVKYDPDKPGELLDYTPNKAQKDSLDLALSEINKKESLSKEDLYQYMKLQEQKEQLYTPVKFKYKEYRNLPYLGIGIPALAGSIYFLTRHSMYSDQIADIEETEKLWGVKSDKGKYEDRSTNNLLAGIGFGLVGIAATVYALIPAEISVSPNTITLKYNF